MARFFFDIHDDTGSHIDADGHEFGSLDQVRKEAQRLLPDIARHELPEDGDRRSYVVLVRDENGQPVYSATLTYAGVILAPDRDAIRASFVRGTSICE